MSSYPLAAQGVYRTVQGEGYLAGTPMVFVRLGGCSVGCAECDTDYRVTARATAQEIHDRVLAAGPCEWTWVTGGEPADHDLWELLNWLRLCGRTALATSGHKGLKAAGRWSFLSVSPHGKPEELVVRQGSQINLVPGLNGLRLSDWERFDATGFRWRYVTPCHGNPDAILECSDWLSRHPDWRLGVQAHKVWQIA